MLRDITLGQYYPVSSPIHSLDPRVKIIFTLIFITMAFFTGTFLGLGFMLLFLLSITLVAKIPVKALLKGLKPVLVLIIFTFVLNMFFTKGSSEPIFAWKFITLYKEGIIRALFMGVRLVLLIMGASLLTLTTSPISLTDGIERLLSPLSKIGFPSHEVAMMMTIALRFIPTLLEEADRIMKAQAARGAVFDEGSLINRAKAIVPLLVPLFVSAFRRAEELAMAMEARCYHGGEGRTRLKVLKFQKGDAVAAAIIVAFILLILADFIFLRRLLPFLSRV